ncbi:MAG: heat-inducible transcriptional repressor HrcA [Actinomycetota bacterium]
MALSGLDDRKATILRAIVSHYVRSGEPAGSKTIVDRFGLGVSPATVRNEMVALEESGYIFQPHTSAGRIPTDAGYRYFVDAWARDANLPAPAARRVHAFFTEPHYELEDALRETALLLSDLTDTAAVVFAPVLKRSVVRRAELVQLSSDRAMLLVVADTGRVENLVISLPNALDEEQLHLLNPLLIEVMVGVGVDDAARTLAAATDRFPVEVRDFVTTLAAVLGEDVRERESERLFLEGTSHIVDEDKFADLGTVRQVIGALEHRRLVLEMLADAVAAGSVSVRIGAENPLEEMQFCSVVTAPYGVPGTALGSLGVVGPTRMDYMRTIAAVHEVSGALGRMLGDLGV